jgi:hypothetical protein
MQVPEFATVFGVDFSGAKQAGRTIWIARLELQKRPNPPTPFPEKEGGERKKARALTPPSLLKGRAGGLGSSLPRLVALDRLEELCGTAERATCLAELVRMVNASDAALWGFDCPFGLPLELFSADSTWADQFALLGEYGDDAYRCGVDCIARTKRLPAGPLRTALHCRRQTDLDAKAPFAAFHYRMVYQTFFGLRDLVQPLAGTPGTAILPFQYRKLARAKRVAVECCPASVLKKHALPHQNYKQPKGGPLTRVQREARHAILAGLGKWVRIGDRHRRAIMRNPGGDALDAVLAAVGALHGFREADHAAIARHARYPREGRMYF